MKKKMISIAATAFNEEENLDLFCRQVSDVMAGTGYAHEIVICENGSSDQSLVILRRLHEQDARLRYVSLSRNFGHQGGILAAMHACRGNAVVTMDADLQHPPAFIPKFIAEWERGYQVVNSTREGTRASLVRKLADRAFYHLMDRLAGLRLGQADFRLLDRKVVDALVQLPEAEKFLRGLIAWMGFRQTTIPYLVGKRLHGQSKFKPGHLFDLAFQGITSFTSVPLRMLMKLGLLIFVPSFLFMLYTLITGFLNLIGVGSHSLPPGWATLSVTITLFGSIQLLAISILGEYIGRIYIESKNRPGFIVQETSETHEGS